MGEEPKGAMHPLHIFKIPLPLHYRPWLDHGGRLHGWTGKLKSHSQLHQGPEYFANLVLKILILLILHQRAPTCIIKLPVQFNRPCTPAVYGFVLHAHKLVPPAFCPPTLCSRSTLA